MFSIRVKELFQPLVLPKKNKQTNKGEGFLLYLKTFPETDLWLTLGDLTVQKRKNGKGNQYLT